MRKRKGGGRVQGANQVRVLACLRAGRPALFEVEHRLWGAEICRLTGLPSGVVYPILHTLMGKSVVLTELEEGNAWVLRRPLRKFYRMTPSMELHCNFYRTEATLSISHAALFSLSGAERFCCCSHR